LWETTWWWVFFEHEVIMREVGVGVSRTPISKGPHGYLIQYQELLIALGSGMEGIFGTAGVDLL
jgi:hypothetical protein